jgi:hypothetical protein
MRAIRIPRALVNWRVAAIAVLAVGAGFALAARCIEKPYTYVDSEGYTHITGRMVNDTDIQGAQLMLRGTLYDAAGSVVATKDQAPCPPDLKPYSEVSFDIRFDNPNVPPWDRFDVRPISGQALPGPLPDPDVVLFSAQAVRFEGLPPLPGLPFDGDDVLFTFSVRNRSQNTYKIQFCSIVIDNQSQVIAANNGEVVDVDEAGNVQPALLTPAPYPVQIYAIARDAAKGPIQVKAWLWFGDKDAPTSAWQYVETSLFTIQTVNP